MKQDPDDRPLGSLPLFEQPPAQRHSATSTAAAEEIKPSAGTLRARVLDELRSRKDWGATDEELQDALGINPSTERPRRIELVNMKLVADSGRTRKTKSNRSATVWVAVF